jgi:hypothetical protein
MRPNDWTKPERGIQPEAVPAARYVRPPILPREFYEPNTLRTIGFVAYGLMFFVGFGAIARGLCFPSCRHCFLINIIRHY